MGRQARAADNNQPRLRGPGGPPLGLASTEGLGAACGTGATGLCREQAYSPSAHGKRYKRRDDEHRVSQAGDSLCKRPGNVRGEDKGEREPCHQYVRPHGRLALAVGRVPGRHRAARATFKRASPAELSATSGS